MYYFSINNCVLFICYLMLFQISSYNGLTVKTTHLHKTAPQTTTTANIDIKDTNNNNNNNENKHHAHVNNNNSILNAINNKPSSIDKNNKEIAVKVNNNKVQNNNKTCDKNPCKLNHLCVVDPKKGYKCLLTVTQTPAVPQSSETSTNPNNHNSNNNKNNNQELNELMINESLLLQSQLDICNEKYNCKKNGAIIHSEPVCSNDNRTYLNECLFNFNACLTKQKIKIKCKKKCPC